MSVRRSASLQVTARMWLEMCGSLYPEQSRLGVSKRGPGDACSLLDWGNPERLRGVGLKGPGGLSLGVGPREPEGPVPGLG